MPDVSAHLGFLRALSWPQALQVAGVLIGSSLLTLVVRRIVRQVAENSPSQRRLLIMRAAPIARLLIGFGAVTIIIPILVEPNFEDVLALIATVALALAFAIKDYVSCLIAGVFTILENTYQPGDWIEIDGTYGEVTAIGTRAVHIVTADDTEVIIPHARIWTSSLANATSGKQSLLCTTHFYLQADHDGTAVCRALTEVAENCQYRKADTAVKVMAAELPWGTRYKLKVYAARSREQFAMVSDLTIRGKERLRSLGVTFAQTPYAENARR